MTRFQGVRLRNGLGCVNARDGSFCPPPDGPDFRVAEGATAGHALFYAVDLEHAPSAVAVLLPEKGRFPGDEAEAHCACLLQNAGFPVVVSIVADAPAAAVGSAYGAAEDTLARAAYAVWAVKALAGWDESELMTFLLTHIEANAPTANTSRTPTRTAGWLSVRARWNTPGWTVDVDWPCRRGWPAVFEALPIDSTHRHAYALLADVDRTMVYNDACGHVQGDLMLTRVHACLESIALRRGARFVQVGGEEFVMLVHATFSEACRFAEELRHRIEALHIPLSHPEIRTPGMVTVSIGVAPVSAGPVLKERLEAAVDAAKRAGRNRVWADG